MMGHEFDTTIDLNYTGKGAHQSCTLEWWERSNFPPNKKHAPNTWIDIHAVDPFSFGWWDKGRSKPCPGDKETLKDTDQPQQGTHEGSTPRTRTRVLEFRIIVRSAAGCPCDDACIRMTARQTLKVDNGVPDWANSSFESPNPSDPPSSKNYCQAEDT
jgi:hypothetical protein